MSDDQTQQTPATRKPENDPNFTERQFGLITVRRLGPNQYRAYLPDRLFASGPQEDPAAAIGALWLLWDEQITAAIVALQPKDSELGMALDAEAGMYWRDHVGDFSPEAARSILEFAERRAKWHAHATIRLSDLTDSISDYRAGARK